MSYRNPTPIQLGMTGTFAGKQFRVAGRVVMGMEQDGGTYHWNEFNLVADDGDFITLVNEPTVHGDVWRLFTMFEPETAMTTQQAAAIQVGQRVNLEGKSVRVTLVDESQVYDIEGEAPEGVEVGDVARYFNAEMGDNMYVVSWTGDEVECFRGVVIQRRNVAKAFNLQLEALRQTAAAAATRAASDFESGETGGSSSGSGTGKLWVILAIVGIFTGILLIRSCGRGTLNFQSRAQVLRKSAPTLSKGISVGSRGTLNGKTYQVRGHALVEISEVGVIYQRHEFLLTDDEDNRALLIYPAMPDAKDWLLMEALPLASALRPAQVAALKLGEPLRVDDDDFIVKRLFQSWVSTSDLPDEKHLNSGAVAFGLFANDGSRFLQGRWNESSLSLHRGKFVREKEVTAAFPAK